MVNGDGDGEWDGVVVYCIVASDHRYVTQNSTVGRAFDTSAMLCDAYHMRIFYEYVHACQFSPIFAIEYYSIHAYY